uniref:Olfactory receptor n=1 Tax=Chelonoidis abingdonii TaxID=106734 RepID=A0A8C0IQG6_CHEAB
MGNQTNVSHFILLGFPTSAELQLLLFSVFLLAYFLTLMENIIIILVIRANHQLHKPMYFFLGNLSFLEIWYVTVIVPKMLADFVTQDKAISYNGCAAQMFFFSLFGTTEAFFLAVMAYDRFVAICNPLRYPITMSKRTCAFLVAGSYLSGCLNSSIQTGFTFTLSFCRPGKMDHFFCDVPAVMQASCSDTFANEMVMLAVCGFIIVSTGLVVLISYGYIITTVTQIPSAEGRHRAFSTCTSHLVAVSLFFGTVFFMYAQPGAITSPGQSKVVSVFYTIVIPMLNPLIYSLRNKEVKATSRGKQ